MSLYLSVVVANDTTGISLLLLHRGRVDIDTLLRYVCVELRHSLGIPFKEVVTNNLSEMARSRNLCAITDKCIKIPTLSQRCAQVITGAPKC